MFGITILLASPQKNANRAWCALGNELGFDGMSVQPSDRGKRFFTAVPVSSADPGRPVPRHGSGCVTA